MIFYFSGTGNSMYVAEKIAVMQNEHFFSIAECMRNKRFDFTLKDDEKIGFIFPVYFYGIPTIVADFVRQLRLANYKAQYSFAVCTCGAISALSLNMFGKLLNKQDIKLNFGYTIIMPDNYIVLFNLMTPAEKIGGILANAEKSIAEVNAGIAECSLGIDKRYRGIFPHLMTFLSYSIYKAGRNTRHFYATDKCTGCGLCEKICPCGMIYMEDKHPVWTKGKCTQCLGCLHRCPVGCIEYGKKTVGRKRYVNPNVYK
jgi:NAD-dependent dihydropyrimidine dehydrogenase PreA subunit